MTITCLICILSPRYRSGCAGPCPCSELCWWCKPRSSTESNPWTKELLQGEGEQTGCSTAYRCNLSMVFIHKHSQGIYGYRICNRTPALVLNLHDKVHWSHSHFCLWISSESTSWGTSWHCCGEDLDMNFKISWKVEKTEIHLCILALHAFWKAKVDPRSVFVHDRRVDSTAFVLEEQYYCFKSK